MFIYYRKESTSYCINCVWKLRLLLITYHTSIITKILLCYLAKIKKNLVVLTSCNFLFFNNNLIVKDKMIWIGSLELHNSWQIWHNFVTIYESYDNNEHIFSKIKERKNLSNLLPQILFLSASHKPKTI